jgi:hypothetical protein
MSKTIEIMALQVLTALGEGEAAANRVIDQIAVEYGAEVQHVVLNEVRRLQRGD